MNINMDWIILIVAGLCETGFTYCLGRANNKPFSVCKVGDYSQVDLTADYVFIGKTDEERSLVCETPLAPANTIEREDGWRAFRIEGVARRLGRERPV